MPTRNGKARWEGTLTKGNGEVTFAGKSFPYSFPSRFEEGEGTSPEELIAAAHAGCFAMALAHELSEGGYKVNSVETRADVTLSKISGDFAIDRIELAVDGDVDEIDPDVFAEYADQAKRNCPVSRALGGVDRITVRANLVG